MRTSPQIIVRRQRHRDQDGDERDHDVVGAHAEKSSFGPIVANAIAIGKLRPRAITRISDQIEPVARNGVSGVSWRVPRGALVIVVLASHSPPRDTVLRLLATKPRFSKKPRAVSLASTVIPWRRARRRASPAHRTAWRRRPARPRPDAHRACRCAYCRRARQSRPERRRTSRPASARRQVCAERVQIVSGRRPRLLLRVAVILAVSSSMLAPEDFREQRHVLRQHARASTSRDGGRPPSSRDLPGGAVLGSSAHAHV